MKTRLIVTAILSLAVGLVLGRSCASPRPSGTAGGANLSAPKAEAWTCSMHPQVRLGQPGNCPICEMPLISAGTVQAASGTTPTLQFSDHALRMAAIETSPVTRRELSKELRAVGKIRYNEASLATITARVDGYAERLFVDFTGVEIKAGEHLAEIYSPELLVAQQELIVAAQSGERGAAGALAENAELKLQRWGLTPEQIKALRENHRVTDRVTLYSPIDGTVIEKTIVQNSAFKAGDALYRVANLDTVWVYLDLYEYDLPWIRYGQKVEITAEALPGTTFEGRVTFVQPLVDEQTRTIRVPVHVANPGHALKPGMFVSAVIRVALTADGRAAATGIEGQYSCSMHPQVLQPQAGSCSLCGMPLVQVPGADAPVGATASPAAVPRFQCPMKCEGEKTYDTPVHCPVCNMKTEERAVQSVGSGLLAIPASAVLDSGTRKRVYVERTHGLFEPRDVVLGPRSGDFCLVISGVEEGERVATRGGFLIDSQFQITGHPSLFYPGGLLGPVSPPETAPATNANHSHAHP
jgi:Cu(I)/Ag(I) efflux system membrane fusion protein